LAERLNSQAFSSTIFGALLDQGGGAFQHLMKFKAKLHARFLPRARN
jgi:hypothetical protein